jgi:EAL domain-containing protein (putative c-di-GMP-specific phosphodiesterase class I)
MRTDAMSLVLTESIHRIGKILGKVTVGDFAEDEITIEGLRDMGVDFAQGYGVGQPQML